MTSPVDEWISLPGFAADEETLTNGNPDEFEAFIDNYEAQVSFRPADVFMVSGNKKFSVIFVNKLKPQMLWVAMSEKKIKEVLFSNVETV